MQQDFLPVWQQFQPKLKALVCRVVKHDDICQDLLQEVYIKMLTHLDRIMAASNPNAYVMRLAHNTITDHYRARNKVPEQVSDEHIAAHPDEKDDRPPYQLADRHLRPMIDELPDIYREALVLAELEGITQQQLADRLGISLPAAKSRVQRGREKLKEKVQQCCNYRFDKYGNIISCCGD